jgi:hypothetical protein
MARIRVQVPGGNMKSIVVSASQSGGSDPPATPGSQSPLTQAQQNAVLALIQASVISTASITNNNSGTSIGGASAVFPGGADTDLQYNKSGTFYGDSNLTWNYTSQILTVSGTAIIAPASGIALTATSSGNSREALRLDATATNSQGALTIYDTTNSALRGYIGSGVVVTGMAVTDIAIAPGASGNFIVGTALGGSVGAKFGAGGGLTLNAPSSGATLAVVGGNSYGITVSGVSTGTNLFNFSASGGDALYGYSDSGGSGIANSSPFSGGALIYLNSTNTSFYVGGTQSVSIGSTGLLVTAFTGQLAANFTGVSGAACLQASTVANGTVASFHSPNGTAQGCNFNFYDTTASTYRGFIGYGTSTITGALVSDFCIAPGPSGRVLIGTSNGGGIGATFDTSGDVLIHGQLSINGASGAAALSGFGSPSGTVTANLTSAATLAQTASTLAALLAYLKSIGFIAA